MWSFDPNKKVDFSNLQKTNSTYTYLYDAKFLGGKGKLAGASFSIKDNFNIKGTATTLGSKMLTSYKPLTNSRVYEKLILEGGIPLYKSNMDSFGMGGKGLSSSFGNVYHPLNKNYLIGGSSSGSAFLFGNGSVDFSIGTDTGDSVRKPSSYIHSIGFKPTWGSVSKYGVSNFAPSWDTVAWFTKNVRDSGLLLEILMESKEDYLREIKRDNSLVDPKYFNFNKNNITKELDTKNKFTLGVFENFLDEEIYDDIVILDNFKETIKKLENDGNKIIYIKDYDFDLLSSIDIVYKVISSIEGFSSTSSITGFLFGDLFDNSSKGNFDQKINDSRTKGIPYEVKKRYLFANYFLCEKPQFYKKLLMARTLIIKEISKIYHDNKIDGLISPTNSKSLILVEENSEFEEKMVINNDLPHRTKLFLENHLSLFNCNGSPSLVIPTSDIDDKKPTALNINTLPFNDLLCLQIGKKIETLVNKK